MLFVFGALALVALYGVVRLSGLKRLSALCSFVIFCITIARLIGVPGIPPWL